MEPIKEGWVNRGNVHPPASTPKPPVTKVPVKSAKSNHQPNSQLSDQKYFVISNSDGDTTVKEHSKDELEKNINDQYWGNVGFIDKINEHDIGKIIF
jgi:hypothetical protein